MENNNNNNVATELQAYNLVKRYTRRGPIVVNEVSLSVQQGEIVGLLGPNGAGKSTTFYIMVGIIRPNSGRIVYGERDITFLPMYKRARLGIGYLSQETSIFRKLTVKQNIEAILEAGGMPKDERETRIIEFTDELGISHLLDRKAYTLSGGESVDVLRLREHWRHNLNSFYWMNHFQVLILLQLLILSS